MRYMRYRDENLILQYLFPMDIIRQGTYSMLYLLLSVS